jgi:hypothetical protein
MAADPQHYQKLIASVAPRVIDMDSVKRGLLCQLFGGVSKSTAAALGGDSTSRCVRRAGGGPMPQHPGQQAAIRNSLIELPGTCYVCLVMCRGQAVCRKVQLPGAGTGSAAWCRHWLSCMCLEGVRG